MDMPAVTPKPPYYAVIFTSVRRDGDNGYNEAAAQMLALAATQPGFLGAEMARQDIGISVSYWATLESIGHGRRVSLIATFKVGRRSGIARFGCVCAVWSGSMALIGLPISPRAAGCVYTDTFCTAG